MKFIELDVLCIKTETEDSAYANVLAELNIVTENEKEYYWKKISFNKSSFEEEIYAIEERKDHPLESVISFYGGESVTVKIPPHKLIEKLEKI